MEEHFGLRIRDVIRKEQAIVIRGHFGSVRGKTDVNGQEAILISLEGPGQTTASDSASRYRLFMNA